MLPIYQLMHIYFYNCLIFLGSLHLSISLAKQTRSKAEKKAAKQEEKLNKTVNEAEEFVKQKKNTKAIQKYKKAIQLLHKRYPRNTNLNLASLDRAAIYYPYLISGGLYYRLGDVYLKNKGYKKAKKALKKAIAYFQRVLTQESKKNEQKIEIGDQESESYSKKSEEIFGLSYASLAAYYLYKKSYGKALKSYRDALPWTHNPSRKLEIYLKVGLLYEHAIAQYKKSTPYEEVIRLGYEEEKLYAYLQAIKIERKYAIQIEREDYFTLYFHAGMALYQVAYCYWNDKEKPKWIPKKIDHYTRQQTYQAAASSLRKAFAIHTDLIEKIEDYHLQVANLASYLGMVYFQLENYEQALKYQKKALSIGRKEQKIPKEWRDTNEKTIATIQYHISKQAKSANQPPQMATQAQLIQDRGKATHSSSEEESQENSLPTKDEKVTTDPNQSNLENQEEVTSSEEDDSINVTANDPLQLSGQESYLLGPMVTKGEASKEQPIRDSYENEVDNSHQDDEQIIESHASAEESVNDHQARDHNLSTQNKGKITSQQTSHTSDPVVVTHTSYSSLALAGGFSVALVLLTYSQLNGSRKEKLQDSQK
ncbi:MAG: tetratricopeptide repeat protein [Bacteroidota bacterium]